MSVVGWDVKRRWWKGRILLRAEGGIGRERGHRGGEGKGRGRWRERKGRGEDGEGGKGRGKDGARIGRETVAGREEAYTSS